MSDTDSPAEERRISAPAFFIDDGSGKSLDERIRRFDGDHGESLDAYSYRELGVMAHAQLRDLLLESGYRVIITESVKREQDSHFRYRHVYSRRRANDNATDVLAERNIRSWCEHGPPGFTYLCFSDFPDHHYQEFLQEYQIAAGTAVSIRRYNWLVNAGAVGVGAGMVLLAAGHTRAGAIVAAASGLVSLIPYGLRHYAQQEALDSVREAAMVVNPHEAVRRALGLTRQSD